ncbi:mitochondrial ribosomal protein S10 [Scheffersomyces amazonensis]|uniref:mitochondrial ribosomal protein S10 n=1 Tax=Scheffersomyces amazonensis TaxID=1078765 RepID=UPI00315D4DCE
MVGFSMIVRRQMARPSMRSFMTSSIWNQKSETNVNFKSPEEYIEQQKINRIEEQQYRQTLLGEKFEYNPKYLSETKTDAISGRPIPINVELLKYKPLRLEPTEGNEIATIKLQGYDENSLIRAGEFALRAAFYLGIPTSPLNTLKTEKRLYTVIKSPFAQAKTKQNFHRTTFKKSLIAYDADPEVIDLWLSYINKYKIEGVQYAASITTTETLEFSKQLENLKEIEFPQAYDEMNDPIANKVKDLLKSDTFKKYLNESK